MLSIWNNRHNDVNDDDVPRIAIIGDYVRRDFVKSALGQSVDVVGELVRDHKVELLDAVTPDIVFLDCGSPGINPFDSLPRLVALPGDPLIVAIARTSTTTEEDRHALQARGAHFVLSIGDTAALARIVGSIRRSRQRDDRSGRSPVAA